MKSITLICLLVLTSSQVPAFQFYHCFFGKEVRRLQQAIITNTLTKANAGYELKEAAKTGQINAIKFLLGLNEDLKPNDDDIKIALEVAVNANKKFAAEELLISQTNIRTHVNQILESVAGQGNLSAVALICGLRAQIKPKYLGGALKASTSQGHTRIATYLINLLINCHEHWIGDNDLDCALKQTASAGNLEVMKMLTSAYELYLDLHYTGNALKASIYAGKIEVTRHLLSLPSTIRPKIEPFLLDAVKRGKIEDVDLLLRLPEDIIKKGMTSMRPFQRMSDLALEHAYNEKNILIIKYLCELTQDIRPISAVSCIFKKAIAERDTVTVEYLVGLTPQMRPRLSDFLISDLIKAGNLPAIKYSFTLTEHLSADDYLLNKAAIDACQYGKLEILKYIFDLPENIRANLRSSTNAYNMKLILLTASKLGHEAIVLYLLNLPNAQTRFGDNAITEAYHEACTRRHDRIIERLRPFLINELQEQQRLYEEGRALELAAVVL